MQWSDANPHYRPITYGKVMQSQRYVILWGMSNTPIAYVTGEEQAKRVSERLVSVLAEIEAEENKDA